MRYLVIAYISSLFLLLLVMVAETIEGPDNSLPPVENEGKHSIMLDEQPKPDSIPLVNDKISLIPSDSLPLPPLIISG